MKRNPGINIDGKQLFGSLGFEDSQGRGDGFEHCWQWPEEIGNGHLYTIKLRPGLTLGIGRYLLKEKIRVVSTLKASPISLVFGVTGNVDYSVTHSRGKNGFKLFPGHRTVTCLPECRNLAMPVPGVKVQYLSLLISPSLLTSLIGLDQGRASGGLPDFSLDGQTFYHEYSPITPEVNMVIHQILNCPYDNPLKRLYFESKALELIVHSMASWLAPKAPASKTAAIKPTEMERVAYAKKLVEKNFSAPPNLLEVAGEVGLAHARLNFCFKELYGTTLFGHIRKMRLDRARQLLEEGRMNVTEVAYDVGYSSLSHFAKVFKSRFGVAPGQYLGNGWR